MLLRFAVANHLSIRTHQELSLVASSLKDETSGLLHTDVAAATNVLPVAVIYGANASGKSNLIHALNFMRTAVLMSHSRGEPSGGVPRAPFALDSTAEAKISSYDIDFILDGTRYHYGFTASSNRFENEWLYAFPNSRRQLLFEREQDLYKFGRSLRGKNRTLSELTRANSLFLSSATQNDHEDLGRISAYFRQIKSARSVYVGGSSVSRTLHGSQLDPRILDYLGQIGTGVISFQWTDAELSDQVLKIRTEINEALTRAIGSGVEIEIDSTKPEIQLGHRGVDGKEVFIDLDRESAGTRRLLVLLKHIYNALDEGSLVVLDEMDASLHTQVCESIVRLFSTSLSNPKGAQLIATTHDTNLLCSSFLRRDQVWFTEKDEEGSTHLYPLSSISTKRSDNLEKGYLQGRFGAVPFAGNVSNLMRDFL